MMCTCTCNNPSHTLKGYFRNGPWATDTGSLTYGLSIGQTTISLMVALAKWRPAMSSHKTAAPWSMIWDKYNEINKMSWWPTLHNIHVYVQQQLTYLHLLSTAIWQVYMTLCICTYIIYSNMCTSFVMSSTILGSIFLNLSSPSSSGGIWWPPDDPLEDDPLAP